MGRKRNPIPRIRSENFRSIHECALAHGLKHETLARLVRESGAKPGLPSGEISGEKIEKALAKLASAIGVGRVESGAPAAPADEDEDEKQADEMGLDEDELGPLGSMSRRKAIAEAEHIEKKNAILTMRIAVEKGELVRVDRVAELVEIIAAEWRQAARTIQRKYGVGAHDIMDEARKRMDKAIAAAIGKQPHGTK